MDFSHYLIKAISDGLFAGSSNNEQKKARRSEHVFTISFQKNSSEIQEKIAAKYH